MEAKTEDIMLDNSMLKEEKPPASNLEVIFRDDSLVQDSDSLKNFPSLNTLKNNSDELEMVSKTMIKEEPWWQEGSSPEVKCQLEVSCDSELQMYSEIKDETNESLAAAELTRLYTETASSSSDTAKSLYTATDLEQKAILKHGKKDPELAVANVLEVFENEVSEASCIAETVPLNKSKTLHGHSEKLSKCSNSSKKIHMCETAKNQSSQPNNLKTYVLHRKSRMLHTKHILSQQVKKSYRCDVCKKCFSRMEHLKRHIFIHEGKKPYKCDICKKAFTTKECLNSHILIHEGKKPYKCEVCEKSFTQIGNLKRHILIHEGKKPYKCEVCEKSFTQIGHLKGHILIHEGRKPYKCDVCEKCFTRIGHLESHSLIHEGIKPYKCNVCEKRFSQMGNLKRHIFFHEGIKSYKCDACEKRFTRIGNLKSHILSHEGIKPYRCDACEKYFSWIGSLKRHIRIHEGVRSKMNDVENVCGS